MNNVKTLLPSRTKAKVATIIFSAAAVLRPQNECFSLHYLCTRLSGRWVERRWMESGRVGNHGTVWQCVRARSSICRLSRWDGKGRWDVAGPYLKASLQCPLNQRWRSLMVHHRHVIPRYSSSSLCPLSLPAVIGFNSSYSLGHRQYRHYKTSSNFIQINIL